MLKVNDLYYHLRNILENEGSINKYNAKVASKYNHKVIYQGFVNVDYNHNFPEFNLLLSN